jgi:hypothetical protein
MTILPSRWLWLRSVPVAAWSCFNRVAGAQVRPVLLGVAVERHERVPVPQERLGRLALALHPQLGDVGIPQPFAVGLRVCADDLREPAAPRATGA